MTRSGSLPDKLDGWGSLRSPPPCWEHNRLHPSTTRPARGSSACTCSAFLRGPVKVRLPRWAEAAISIRFAEAHPVRALCIGAASLRSGDIIAA